jgi:hypothetical protein
MRIPAHRNSQALIVERLIGAGIRADAICLAIELLESGQADLILAVLDRKLAVARALKIAKQRSRP